MKNIISLRALLAVSAVFSFSYPLIAVPTNFALNACVNYNASNQQMSCFGVYEGGHPCDAFDGDMTTSSGAAKIWPHWPLPTLVVDFGQERTIDSVVVYFENNSQNNFYINGTNTPGTWTTLAQVSPSGSVCRKSLTGATYRYMQVAMAVVGDDPGYSPSVLEMQMWGDGAGNPPSLTYYPRTGWTASASTSTSTEPASNTLDGNKTSRWSLGQQPGQTSNQSFTLDMKQEQTVGTINLFSPVTTNGDYLRNYSVYVTNDTNDWGTSVASGTGGVNNLLIYVNPVKTGRYIRIKQTGGTCTCWWSIAEINVAAATGITALRPAHIPPKSAVSASLNAQSDLYSLAGKRISASMRGNRMHAGLVIGVSRSASGSATITKRLLTEYNQ